MDLDILFWLIGVYFAGFLSGYLLAEPIKDRRKRNRYLKDLLADLEYNLRLAKKGKVYGYHTGGYIQAKQLKYLHTLPEEIRILIYDAQTLVSEIYNLKEETIRTKIERLEKLLDELVPKFRKYLGMR